MKISVLTLFPDIINSFFAESIMKRAVAGGFIEQDIVNIRDFAYDKHRTCDDAPYGGGPGMVLKPEPIAAALDSIVTEQSQVVVMSASGRPLSQQIAQEYSSKLHVIVVCGRYEGIDNRVIELFKAEEISIGDYVMSSGEVAALAFIDSVYRLVPGVLRPESLHEESYRGNLLEYPHYTRPECFRGRAVPEVLMSGNHAAISRWRRRAQIKRTLRIRPDLMSGFDLEDIDRDCKDDNGM